MTQGVIEGLIAQFTKLPGIGRKTAQRLAFFVLHMPEQEARDLAGAITEVKEKARFCSRCFNITDRELCEFCRDPSRDRTRLCVVEEPSTILAIERTRIFGGLYHVLLGALSPLDGVTPERLKINELVERVRADGIAEVILATNPNTKGEVTARYITELLKPLQTRVTRIAYGLPIGSDIHGGYGRDRNGVCQAIPYLWMAGVSAPIKPVQVSERLHPPNGLDQVHVEFPIVQFGPGGDSNSAAEGLGIARAGQNIAPLKQFIVAADPHNSSGVLSQREKQTRQVSQALPQGCL